MNDRAVSDVVGYVLVFSLIIATVGVVTTVGFSTLDDRQSAERIGNIERAFDVFATNVEEIYREGAPSRATEMRLAGGEIYHGDSISITIAVQDEEGTNVTVTPRPFVYADGETEIVYVAGSVIRSEPSSAVMLREPPFYMGAETAMFPLVDTFRTTGPETVSTSGTVRITSTARPMNTTVPSAFSEPGQTYTISVESPRSDAWARYFEEQDGIGNVVHEESAGIVTGEIDAEEIHAPRFRVRLRFAE